MARLRFNDHNKKYFFTSDFHLGHHNIIRYSKRPFQTAAEMDTCLIDQTNEMVKEDDVLFYLGDWCAWGMKRYFELAQAYRDRIRCNNIYYIWGNHDKKGFNDPNFKNLWNGCYDLLDADVLGKQFILCHYAMRVWDRSHHGTIHLYGHSHGGLSDDPNALSMDVGVDFAAKHFSWDGTLCPEKYRPFTMDDVLAHMATKVFVPIDHHGRD
jgi:calcineurin-like phosphoesterase family protein